MRVAPNSEGVSRTPVSSVRVRFQAMRAFIADVRAIWLVLDPRPPAFVGLVRHDRTAGLWTARLRGGENGADRVASFPTRKQAAEWLLMRLGGFMPKKWSLSDNPYPLPEPDPGPNPYPLPGPFPTPEPYPFESRL
jgi:hypothetical protein